MSIRPRSSSSHGPSASSPRKYLPLRMLWFGICGGVVLLSMLLLVARLLGPVAGTRALLLSPLVSPRFPR